MIYVIPRVMTYDIRDAASGLTVDSSRLLEVEFEDDVSLYTNLKSM
jgi:hypothetical protein